MKGLVMTEDRAREINLDCGHSLWLKSPWPNVGDQLWCSRCVRYEFVGPMHELAAVLHDTWRSIRKSRRYHGECIAEGCTYSFSGVNFYKVRHRLEMHHIREHTQSTLIIYAPIDIPVEKVKPNTPPSF